MQIGKMGKELIRNTDAYKIGTFFTAVLFLITGAFAVSTQTFTRRKFGERHYGWVNVLCGWTAIGAFCGAGNIIIGSITHEDFSGLMEFLYSAAVVLAVGHRVVIALRNRRGEVWHTQFSGSSWLDFTGLSEEVLNRYVEPALLLFLGYLARHFHQTAVGTWMTIGGLSVFIHETVAYNMLRSQILDARDAQIEASYMNQVLAGKTPQNNNGFSMAKSSINLINRDTQLRDSYAHLPEEMQGIMDTPEVQR